MTAVRSLKARVWIECVSTAELRRFAEYLRAEFGWEVPDPEPGRRYYLATYAVASPDFKDALWDGEHRAEGLLEAFGGDARLVRVDLFEEGAPNLQVLNAQVGAARAAA